MSKVMHSERQAMPKTVNVSNDTRTWALNAAWVGLVRSWGLSVIATVPLWRNWRVTAGLFLGGLGTLIPLFASIQHFTPISKDALTSVPVPQGKVRICVIGVTHSPPTAKAHRLAALIGAAFPEHYETWYYFDNFSAFKFMKKRTEHEVFPEHLKGHSSSPFVYLEHDNGDFTPIGGSDHFAEWAQTHLVRSLSTQFSEWTSNCLHLEGGSHSVQDADGPLHRSCIPCVPPKRYC